jgi:hypothetical protein
MVIVALTIVTSSILDGSARPSLRQLAVFIAQPQASGADDVQLAVRIVRRL